LGITADALFGKVRQRVLGLLFGRADRRFYQQDVVRAVGAGTGAVQRELAALVEAGLVTRSRDGNRVYYQANQSAPVFPELRGLMLKTVALAEVVREALAPLADRILSAFIYGSLAAGFERLDSDVDLVVIGEVSLREVVGALADAQEALGREINPVVYSPQEIEERLARAEGFISRVVNGPRIVLLGDENVLQPVGG
jgi:predicted nucleotidyltransferase